MDNFEATEIKTYKTYNTEIFKKLLGNREVTHSRVAQIKKSIQKVGYVINPIIVNEKMEVIDGQGRLQALSELSLPIYFQIQAGLGIEECISMNIKMKNWNFMDYVISYKDMGNEDYNILYSAIKNYKSLSAPVIAGVLMECTSTGHNFNQIISEGYFKVKNYSKSKYILDFLNSNIGFIKMMDCNCNVVMNVLAGLAREELIDIDRMSESIENYYGMVKNGYTVESLLGELQDVYNYKKRTKLYFRDAYIAKIMHGRH